MSFIVWGPKLEVGIGIIDQQHKKLVDMINELDVALQEGRGDTSVGETIAGLVEYTHTHFRTEENLLHVNDYDDYDFHRREHKIFTDQIEIYRDRFASGLMDFSMDVMQYLRGWLVTHITVSDRAYIRTLKDAGVE